MKSKTKAALAGPAAILLGLLSACNPAPKYARPPAAAPQAFKEAVPQDYKEGQGWKIAIPQDEKIRGKWWEMYNDPQLSALEEQVQVSNQSLKTTEANFRSARALIAYARSGLFPTLTSNPAYTNSRTSATSRTFVVGGGATTTTSGGTTNGGTTGGGTTTGGTTGGTTNGGSGTGSTTGGTVSSLASPINTFSLPFDISYTVDLWHRVRNTVLVDAYQAQASAADIATSLLSLQSELAQNYFQIRALDAQRRILTETVENYRQTLDLTQIRFRGGIASDEDVSQAQTQVDTAIASQTDVGVLRAQYEHAIAVLIGKPAANFELPAGEFVPHPPPVPVAVPSELLQRRPDIAAAERQVAAANTQIGVVKAAYYPSLALSASGGFNTSHFTEWFTWPSRFWSLGPTLSQTLLDGGARRAQVAQAQASYEGTVATYRQTVLTSFQAVEDQLAALRILSQEIGEQHTAVASANHYLDLSLIRYRGGVDSFLTVITAQTAVLTSREAEVQVSLRLMTASVALVLALGGGWNSSQLPTVQQLTTNSKASSSGTPAMDTTKQPVAAPNPPPLPQRAAPANPSR